jgi:GDP-4-dehydro-6-deoxy-D-mannose reductase
MNYRALITGGNGFVGRVLHDHLAAQGWEVVRCDRTMAPGVLPCDITDPIQIADTLHAAGALTHVFHLAAMAFVPDANRNPAGAMNVNLNGTIHLANALLERHPGVRLIYVSSGEIYGPPQALPITEAHPVQPMNPYAISKAAADSYCAYLSAATRLDVVRLRPFNHAGPGQSDQYVLSNFARQVAAIEAGFAEPVLKTGNLTAARDFLHVNDVVRAYELAALRGRRGEAYNVCSGRARSVQEALSLLLGMSTLPIAVAQDPARLRPVDIPEIAGSHQKFTSDTGWQPETSFETILTDLLKAWQSRLAQESRPLP